MLKKGAFSWSVVVIKAFSQLKMALTAWPILAMSNFAKTFVVECDVSTSSIEAVLLEDHRPIALHDQNQALSVYDKELQALVLRVKKWRSYLLRRKFVV